MVTKFTSQTALHDYLFKHFNQNGFVYIEVWSPNVDETPPQVFRGWYVWREGDTSPWRMSPNIQIPSCSYHNYRNTSLEITKPSAPKGLSIVSFSPHPNPSCLPDETVPGGSPSGLNLNHPTLINRVITKITPQRFKELLRV